METKHENKEIYTNVEINNRFWNAFWAGFICGAGVVVFIIGLYKEGII